MNILLAAINARYIHSNPAVYSLRACSGQWQDHIHIAEYTINHLPERILADLYIRKPDVIAFSCYIWNYSIVRRLLKELPKILPDTDIWLGGPEVSFDAPKVIADNPYIKGVMIGEGEETFRQLCRYYVEGDSLPAAIPGLCLPETGYTPKVLPCNLDDIPFIYNGLSGFENRILYYESMRGCPFCCSYCLSSIDKTVRIRSLDKVYRELDFFLEHKVPQVKFIDRTFNIDHEHCMSIWRYIKDHDNKVTNYHFEIAGDLLREDELQLLSSMRPGLVQLEIGVQTANPAALKEVRRITNLELIRENVQKLRVNNNIHIHLDLIAGLPMEDLESFKKSFDEIYNMGCEELQLGFLKVLKGSFMQEKAEEYELKYLSEPPYEILSTKWLSYSDILELKQTAGMLEIYHNSHQFDATIRQLQREYESPYKLYLDLAEFYRSRGYGELQPSRAELFSILLDFALALHPEIRALYTELITFDIYSRERCRRRPVFAADLEPYTRIIRNIQERKEDHTEVFFYRVWEDHPGIRSDEPYYVTFDYEHRNPVTGNAAIRIQYSAGA